VTRTACVSVVLAVLAYAAGSWLTLGYSVWTAEGARRLQVHRAPVPAPSISVVTPSQGTQPLAALLGPGRSVTVLSFFYTRCPSICLALGSTLQQMQQALQQPPQTAVRLLSLSFDPAHDSPDALQAYSRQMRADPALWQFATPVDAAALHRLLKPFGVVVVADGRGGYDHNAALLVVNRQGQLVRIFDDTDPEAALAFARQLAGESAGD
jgi:protein SCO1